MNPPQYVRNIGLNQPSSTEFQTALGISKGKIHASEMTMYSLMNSPLCFGPPIGRYWMQGTPIEFEEVSMQKDGLHTSIVHKFPLVDAKGKIYAIGGLVTDISGRKRTEEQLRQRQEEHRRLIENVPEVVWKTDEHDRVFFISSKIEEVFG